MSRRRPSGADAPDALALDLFAGGAGGAGGTASRPTAAKPAANTAANTAARAATASEPAAPAKPAREKSTRERSPASRAARARDTSWEASSDIPGSSAASAVAISTLTSTVKDLLEGAFLPLWVRGEISDFKAHRNGHWYFCLRDASSQIRCVVWARDQRGIPAPPDDGMQVTALGQLTVYAARGDLQFTVKAMDAAGDGLWRKALERARVALEADGLLAPERKRALPRYPRRVAIVTSPSGAALHDIIAVARRRWAAVELVVVPAKVQGEGAPEELCAALEQVSRWGDADVVIVGRGGGAREDLWAFNDERVARALAACRIPTISAVGHEVDITLCDLVADLRAPTPSAAAESAVPLLTDAVAATERLRGRLYGAAHERLGQAQREREHAAHWLQHRAAALIARRQSRVRELAGRLEALSPLAVLARGFAVARDGTGRTLRSVHDFGVGSPVSLLVRDGRVQARVEAVEAGGPLTAAASAAHSSTHVAPSGQEPA